MTCDQPRTYDSVKWTETSHEQKYNIGRGGSDKEMMSKYKYGLEKVSRNV